MAKNHSKMAPTWKQRGIKTENVYIDLPLVFALKKKMKKNNSLVSIPKLLLFAIVISRYKFLEYFNVGFRVNISALFI